MSSSPANLGRTGYLLRLVSRARIGWPARGWRKKDEGVGA